MASYNKVILMGNLTRDPQMSYLPSNTPVVDFGMAVNRRWRGREGEQREDVCFIDCRCYGKQAETINQYMSKGRPILIEGRLEFDQWEGKDGQRRSKHRVFVERFTFVDGGGSGGGGGGGQGGSRQGASYRQRPSGPSPSAPPAYDEEPPPPPDDMSEGEEIPF